MRTTILIIQIRMRRLRTAHDGEVLPLGNITMRYPRIVRCIARVPRLARNDAHCFYGNDAFQGEIRLVSKLALEIVCGELVCWYQGFSDEVSGPLLEDCVVLGEVGDVICALGVGKGGDDHVAAFFERHGFWDC